MITTHPILWQFTFSHFNEKARWALDYKGISHVRRSLVPGFHVRTIKEMTGQTETPVLQINGQTVFDSTRIIQVLEDFQTEPPLYPSDPEQRRRALELEDFFDEELGPHVRRVAFYYGLPFPGYLSALFTSENGWAQRLAFRAAFPLLRRQVKRALGIDAAAAELGKRKVLEALDLIEQELRGSPYLVGNRFTVADLTAAALLSIVVLPPEFPYLPQRPAPESITNVFESFMGHSAVRWVKEIYRRHRSRSGVRSRALVGS